MAIFFALHWKWTLFSVQWQSRLGLVHLIVLGPVLQIDSAAAAVLQGSVSQSFTGESLISCVIMTANK